MLNKRNLTDFYSQLAATAEVFSIIHESNNELEKVIIGNLSASEKKSVENPLLDAAQRLILANIHASELRAFAEFLCVYMHTHNFKKQSSVPKNTNFIGDFVSLTDYDLLAKINLYNHTINCALCAIEECKEQPQAIKDIVIVIALLHDFGKCSSILRQFNDKNENHEKISARFALNALIDFDVSDELKNVIFATLFDYHTSDKEKEKTIFAPIVIKADITSRILEKKFLQDRK